MCPMFALWWNGIHIFGSFKEFLCFIQVRRKTWYETVWNQIAEGQDEAINSEEGEAEAEYVETVHRTQARDDDGQG